MPKTRLTAASIEKIRPPATGQVEHFDKLLPAFALRVTDRGKRSFVVFYRVPDDRPQAAPGTRRLIRETIGQYPATTLGDARKKARAILQNPQEHHAAKREPVVPKRPTTYGEVVEDFYERYAKKRQRTADETRRLLLKNCKDWKDRPIASITKNEARDLLEGFVEDGDDYKARVTLAWLKTLWRWAWKRDIVDAPVMDAVDIEIEPRVRDRHYSAAEVRALWRAADQLSPIQGGFVKLLLLLGVRKNELAGMRRSEFDDPDAPTTWTVPHERTKAKKTAKKKRVYVVPLPPLAQRIIKGVPQLDDDLLFPGRHPSQSLDPGTPLKSKVQAKSGVNDWTYHACRDTIATWLQNEGHSEFERGLVLNHAGGGTVTAAYSHGFAADLKRELLEKWADHVRSIVWPKGVEKLHG